MRLSRLSQQQDGVITRQQALRSISVAALKHKVNSGRWQRIYRGVFLTRPGPVTANQRGWAAVLVLDGCLGGLSGLCAWGLRLIKPTRVDVLIVNGRPHRTMAGVATHVTGIPTAIERGSPLAPPSTLPARSLVDAVAWARSDDEARLLVAATFQQRLVTLNEVQREAEQRGNTRRRAVLLSVAADCAGGSHSIGELDLLRLCRRAGLPEPSRQAVIRDRQGRARYVDALFARWKVAIGIDGAHHLNVAQAWSDARRTNDLELGGYLVLRYPAHVLRTEPARVVDDLRMALSNAGWRPRRGQQKTV